MDTICTYCNKHIRVSGDTEGISHGICNDCLLPLLDELGIPFENYLEEISCPALLVDEKGDLVAANKRYLETIGTRKTTAVEFSNGTVPPRTDTGTPLKSTDTVKITVPHPKSGDTETIEGTADIRSGGEYRQLNLLISTVKMGGRTLMQIKDTVDLP